MFTVQFISKHISGWVFMTPPITSLAEGASTATCLILAADYPGCLGKQMHVTW
jgi:hypothetical protein